MHQKRCITCCIGAELQTSLKNIQLLNIFFSNYQVTLTIFPTLLFVIWYIYPPTTSLALVLGDFTIKRMDT
ncbi:hypothetical protein NTE_02578 [Candidatus Nitrososphaera evergladensis SR1]|uniref:Uncharacterized protein n=1 Tax=Candidatus Nitrososphaera evergladensis SR1 TaxID=1459636 RepID=A0A075MVD3_9ARCH|nr:hypothetical protein NTE_02578 [Candidatus Nitrososphaera evergladensis SR1]